MGVVSHSQVGEDLQVSYFLGGKARGVTYIDVGCLWPKEHSNSFFFYERGGHGLCVDPSPGIAGQWARERPRDVFLSAAIGDAPGELTYHEFVNPVYNTFSGERATRLAGIAAGGRDGARETGTREVELITLDEAVQRTGFAARCEGKLGFLSIDVEGLEDAAVAGFSFDALRPRVVVCELIRREGTRVRPEDTAMATAMAAHGYEVGAYTGHDVFFLDAR